MQKIRQLQLELEAVHAESDCQWEIAHDLGHLARLERYGAEWSPDAPCQPLILALDGKFRPPVVVKP